MESNSYPKSLLEDKIQAVIDHNQEYAKLLDALKLCKETQKFSEEMKNKLIHQLDRGYRGWDFESYTYSTIFRQIEEHLARLKKGEAQETDIANLCMFIWYKRKHEKG